MKKVSKPWGQAAPKGAVLSRLKLFAVPFAPPGCITALYCTVIPNPSIFRLIIGINFGVPIFF